MNIKMTINSQLSTTVPKKISKKTSRTETESQMWSSSGWLPVGREMEENGGQDERIKYKWVGTEQAGGCEEQYRKWSSHRIYVHDPWV